MNIKFFFKKASQHRAIFFIRQLKNAAGYWISSEEGMKNIRIDYFSNLFTLIQHLSNIIDSVAQAIEPVIIAEMNHKLTSDVQDVGILDAVKQMFPTKAPGLDGMPPCFTKNTRM